MKLQHQWIAAMLPLSAALFSLSAHAQSPDDDRGFYIGGGVGEFKVEIDDVDDLTSTIDRYDADDTACKLLVGYRLAPYRALEGAYINLGSPSADILPGVRAETEVDGFAPYLVATLPIGPIEIFARGGYFFYDAEASVCRSLGAVTASDDGEEFTYGGGVGITAFERVNLRLEYEVFDVEDTDDTNALWLTAA